MTSVDPPDLPLRPTLRRLAPLWWEQRRLAALGLVCAFVFTGLSLLIPVLVQRVIDEAIQGPHPDRLVPYLAAIVAVAAVRFGINFTRRFATAEMRASRALTVSRTIPAPTIIIRLCSACTTPQPMK